MLFPVGVFVLALLLWKVIKPDYGKTLDIFFNYLNYCAKIYRTPLSVEANDRFTFSRLFNKTYVQFLLVMNLK